MTTATEIRQLTYRAAISEALRQEMTRDPMVVVMGEDVMRAELSRGCPCAIPTTLVSGVFAALDALDVKKVVVAAPYLDEVNRIEADYMADLGYEVLDICGLGITDDADMARVAPGYIRDFAISVDRPDADAIFVCCGALRTVEVIDEIEAAGAEILDGLFFDVGG